MNKIKQEINRSNLNMKQKMRLEYYLTEMAPNGTNDLLIVDMETGDMVVCIHEATFGYPHNVRVKPDAAIYGEFVGDLPDSGTVADQCLYSVSLKQVLECIAVSPVNDGSATVAAIMRLKAQDKEKQ